MKTGSWHIRSKQISTSSPYFGLMGIINVTPDSFYDGGMINTPDDWLAKAGELLENGADILDIGAESSRPGATKLSPELELKRLLPALTDIRAAFPQARISIDTRHAHTAKECLQHGVEIINDISGLQHDPELLEVLSQFRPAYVLTHSKGDPETMQLSPRYGNVIDEIYSFFERSLARLVSAGIPENNIILDPGIGFGKTLNHNLEILKNLERFLAIGRPLLIGLSMKSFFAHLLGHELHARAGDTAIASVLCWQKGVFWHRVHKARQVRDALLLACAIK